MGRRERSNGVRTRERILEEALPLFAEHGFAGTSIRRVANAAGVNVATLAYHFQDKQGLYDTVVQKLHRDLDDALPHIPATPAAELLETVVRISWTFARAHRVELRLLLRHVLDQGRHAEASQNSFTRALLQRGDRLVKGFRPEWSREESRLLLFSVQHLVVRFALEEPQQLSQMLGTDEDIDETVIRWLTAVVNRELGLIR